MKKRILSLLIFCSVLLQAQIQIPQVVGLPAALAGKATKTELDLKQTVFTGICQEQFLTENDIVIDNTALTLTIATVKNGQPISALNPICFYTDGNGTAVKHEKSTPVVFNFTNTDGVWYFYFDSSGNPIATQTSWSDFSTMASVYRFYWNSSLSVADRRVIESIEFHKNDISWSDHLWKHSEGTKYLSGLNISHNATVSAIPNANGSNAVVTLSSGSNIDDNMDYSITHAASGSVKFTQNLGTGLLPATSGKFICISNDASLRLQKISATDFPFLWNPTTNIPQYLTATGVRTDVGNGYFFVYYIYALQDPRYGEAIKIKSAETDFASSTLAAAHNWEQLQSIFPTLRDGEIRLLYKLTFEYKSAYAIGTKKAALRVVDDLRKQKTTTTATAGGLLPATSVVVSPIGNISATNAQSAFQELDSEKQPVGTYSTDIHGNITALNAVSGINTGDETLTSIKTKLGAATSVSDGYLRYQDFALLHTPTTVTASNGLSISGQNISLQDASLTQSGALTFNDYNRFDSKEPAITKNTGFNLPLGTTTGTVLEGRTFGTAANSAVGDFIQNQNASAQSANMWISGIANIGSVTINSSQYIPITIQVPDAEFRQIRYQSPTKEHISYNRDANQNKALEVYREPINGYSPLQLFNITTSGAATFSSTVNATGFLLNGNNLTSSLSTNYIPKWNGSSFVNSLTSDDGTTTTTNVGSSQFLKVYYSSLYNGGVTLKSRYANNNDNSAIHLGASAVDAGSLSLMTATNSTTGLVNRLTINSEGQVSILATTSSTSPTTGALVVNGGIGVGEDIYAAGNIYSNTSELLTPVYQTQTTVNGSISGSIVGAMPFRTGSYKKAMIKISALNGDATYTYPIGFTSGSYKESGGLTGGTASISYGTGALSISSASNASGIIFIEGY